MVSGIKDPAKVRAGAIGARRRWSGHERRIVRLDGLHPAVATAIRALIAADEATKKAVLETPSVADPEVRRDARPAA